MKNQIKSDTEHEELLIGAVIDFYSKHRGYKMTQKEFIGLICALSQQAMCDF